MFVSCYQPQHNELQPSRHVLWSRKTKSAVPIIRVLTAIRTLPKSCYYSVFLIWKPKNVILKLLEILRRINLFERSPASKLDSNGFQFMDQLPERTTDDRPFFRLKHGISEVKWERRPFNFLCQRFYEYISVSPYLQVFLLNYYILISL